MAELAYGIAASILEKLSSVAYDKISLAWGMNKDLKKLQEKTSILQSVLKDAEKKQARNERLRMWLVRLKDVFNDAVDVLDEFECEALRRQVVKEYGSVGTKVCRFFSRSNPVAFRFSIAHKVKEIRERLDEIVQDMAQFQLISSQLNGLEEQSHLIDQENRDRMTHSFVKASEVIGRDGEKAHIIDMLLSQDHNSDDNLSVIAIVGIGGLGKTTLAKSVYNDEKVDERFHLKLWVCVSLDFDVTRLVREILRATKEEEDVNNMSIDELQASLRSNLEGQRFLLVLDDVWNEDRIKWLDLRQFLTGGDEGSQVIVTTRSTSVSLVMTRTAPCHLEGLSQEDSLSLFLTCAFEDERLAERYPRLKDIGKEIVRKCCGVPLALKTLGSLLYSKDEAEWIRVRDSEIWELEREDGRILPALRLSYNTMSPCLKQCFAYCSTFPDDTLMHNIELISIWMALGILQSPYEKMEMEDIAELQLKELRARSFFQYESDDHKLINEMGFNLFLQYKMHDLVHDLTRSATNSECSIVKSGGEVFSDNVRHLRIFLNQNNLTLIERLKKLWSVHIDNTSEFNITKSFLFTCIARLRYLRIFDLHQLSFEMLPSSIGTLKHLRYLNLSDNNRIKRLPESICELQSLQTLMLLGCDELEELPRGIRKLVSLRTLSVTTKQEHFPENGIGCLKSLRTLIIGECENLRSLPHDMKYCTTLRSLYIIVCEELDLASKSDEVAVSELSLQTLFIFNLPKTIALPQWLKGASQTLKLLFIKGCENLVVLPKWLPNFVSLQTLFIEECEELSALPDGMQCLASLTHLAIGDCSQLDLASRLENVIHLTLQVMSIGNLSQTTVLPEWLQGASKALKLLKIEDCPKLVALPKWLSNFSSLEKLYINCCQELLALPEGMQRLTSLIDLELEDCKQLELASESNEVVQMSLQNFYIKALPQTTSLPKWLQGAVHTLRVLRIVDCPKLATLPEWLPDLTSLHVLTIQGCPDLLSLPIGMQRLTSLTDLKIEDCKQLELVSEYNEVVQMSLQNFNIRALLQTRSLPKWLQGAVHTLRVLRIVDCPKLVALPEWLPDFASLHVLTIQGCPELLSLPEGMSRLTSITDLEIRSPSAAFYERYQPEVGRDWAAIAHIPHIHIDNPLMRRELSP